MNPSLLCWLAAFVAFPATAQDALPIVLRVEGSGVDCPDEAAMRRLVADRLGWEPPFAESAQVRLTVRFARVDGELAAHITIEREDAAAGERWLTSSDTDCETLAHHVVLALAIAIDPEAWLGAPSPIVSIDRPAPADANAAPSLPSVRATPASDTERPPGPAPDPGPALGIAVGIGAVAGVGATPEVSGGGRVELTLVIDAFVAGIDVELSHAASTVSEGRVESLVVAADALACGRVSWVSLCAVGRAGAFVARASGFAASFERVGPIGSVGVRLAVAIPLGADLDLQLATDLALPLARTGFVVERERAWLSEPVVGQLALSLILRTTGR